MSINVLDRLDLLHNSLVQIRNGGDEIEAQAESFSAISISAAENAKAFERPDHVFDCDTTRSQSTVLLFLFRCQWMQLTFLERCPRVAMQRIDTLIAGVAQKDNLGQERQSAAFEKCEVVSFSGASGHTHDCFLQWVDHDLPFLGVAFLFAGVASALFFWGRSMRCSLASTTITVRSKEPSCRAFLPGK